jgi:polar amino acid transport system substrate-binding protein
VDNELKVGMELSYPPMEFFDEFKKEAGVDVEIAKALGKALGVKVTLIDLPFDALIGAVDTQKVDIIISAITITEQRSMQIEFVPYMAVGTGIMVKKGNPLQIRKMKDLCGRAVAVQEATSQLDALNAQVCE